MLSDEEMKEYEAFKYYYQTNTEKGISYIPDYMCENVLNLIEKQSNDYIKGQNVVDELCNKKWENKIKAKIEELDKEEKEKLKGTKGQDRYAIKQEYMYKRNILQSLFKKGVDIWKMKN